MDSLGPNPNQHLSVSVTVPKPWADGCGLTEAAGVLTPHDYFAYLLIDAITEALPDTPATNIEVVAYGSKAGGPPGYDITYTPGPERYYFHEDLAVSRAFGNLVKGLQTK